MKSAPDLRRFVYACTEAVYWQLEHRVPKLKGKESRGFEAPITEDMVARYHQMPYFLTKRVGEELAMAYHHQYGIPATSMRFGFVPVRQSTRPSRRRLSSGRNDEAT